MKCNDCFKEREEKMKEYNRLCSELKRKNKTRRKNGQDMLSMPKLSDLLKYHRIKIRKNFPFGKKSRKRIIGVHCKECFGVNLHFEK